MFSYIAHEEKSSWDCPCDGRKIYSKKLYKLYAAMNEIEQGRSFRSPKSFVEEDKAIENAIPASTGYKTKWAVDVLREWQTSRVQKSEVEEEVGLQDISTPLKNFEAERLAYWLGKFVQEVVNKEGKKYPARSLYNLITGIKRFLSDKNIVLKPLDKTDNR